MARYAPLPLLVEQALGRIQPSWDQTLAYYPCRVILTNGGVFDTVYIAPEQSWIRTWGFHPNERRAIRIEDISEVEESPCRLPAQFATELYREGESGMGYTIFTVIFADGQRQAWGGGNAVDFIRYPAGKGPRDVVQVIAHEGRQDPEIQTRPDFYVCLYSGRPLTGDGSVAVTGIAPL